MLTPDGVGFYSDMVVKAFGDAAGNVDEVKSTFFFLCLYRRTTIIKYIRL